jgi:hypothetical protein
MVSQRTNSTLLDAMGILNWMLRFFALAKIACDALFYVAIFCLCFGILCSHVSYSHSAAVKIGRGRLTRKGNTVRSTFFCRTSTTKTNAALQIRGWRIGHVSWKKGLWKCVLQKTWLASPSRRIKLKSSCSCQIPTAITPEASTTEHLGKQHTIIWIHLPGSFRSISIPQTAEISVGEIVEPLLPAQLLSCCQLFVNGKICSTTVLMNTLGPNPCVRTVFNPLRGGTPSFSNSCFVCDPGQSFHQKLLVPSQATEKLVALGWLVPVASEGISTQHFAWDLEHSNRVDMQQSALLNALPDGKQKQILQKRWTHPRCPQDSLLETPVSSNMPSASSSRDEAGVDEVQKPDAASSFHLPEHHQDGQPDAASSFDVPEHHQDGQPDAASSFDVPNTSSQASQPEQGAGIDRNFLLNAAEGHSLSQEDRLKLAQLARSLKVVQKKAGKKKTNAVLAKECLSAMDASDNVAKNLSQKSPPQADAKASTRRCDADQPRGIKRAFQSESEPSKKLDDLMWILWIHCKNRPCFTTRIRWPQPEARGAQKIIAICKDLESQPERRTT